MGGENPPPVIPRIPPRALTLWEYSCTSHEGYCNTIELSNTASGTLMTLIERLRDFILFQCSLRDQAIDNDIYSTVDACPNACEMWKAIERSTGYENQRIGNVVGARETVGSTVVQKSRIQCYNCKEFGHIARECQKPKWVKDAAYHREKMLLCKQEEAGILLNAKQADYAADSGPIFDTEPLQNVSTDDHYNVFSIESEHPDQSESVHDTYPIEQDKHNVIIDSLDMSYDIEQIDQNNDDNDLDNERELLASLIEKLKCEIDDSKNRNKYLETSNKVLIEQLKDEIEDFKNQNKSLESSNNHFKKANNKLSETNKLLYNDFKKSQAELQRHNDVEYASKKEAQIKRYKTCEDKELDKVIALENKIKVLDNIVYKTGQSVQTMNMLNNKCQTSFAKPEFLKKAQRANPRLYDIGCYNDNLALMLAPKFDEVIRCYNDNLALMLAPNSDEVIRLEKESRSKLKLSKSKMMSKSFESVQKHAINLELELQQCKETIKNDKIFKVNQTQDFCKEREQYFEIQDLKAQLQDKGIVIKEMVADLRYFNSLKLEVDSLKSQLETQKTQFLNEIDRLSKEYYYADHMNAILGVYTELDEVTNLQCDYLELLEKYDCLEKELSKSKMMSKSFETLQKHSINLELELQQCKEMMENDESFKVNQSKEFCKEREQYFEIQDLKAQLQDKGIAISIEFPLTEEVPTASEEGCHCLKKREATARKIALLSKSRRNCHSKSNDSFTNRAKIPEADTPPRKRLLLTAPRPGCEIKESSVAAVAR
nr:hypothetical protein [Tanacetum cinerariifolium]